MNEQPPEPGRQSCVASSAKFSALKSLHQVFVERRPFRAGLDPPIVVTTLPAAAAVTNSAPSYAPYPGQPCSGPPRPSPLLFRGVVSFSYEDVSSSDEEDAYFEERWGESPLWCGEV